MKMLVLCLALLLAGCASVAPRAVAPVVAPMPRLWLLPYFDELPLPAHWWRLPCVEDPRPGCAEEV